MGKNYYVYKHTFPNNKVYIGITCLKPEHRWNNGKGYLKKTKGNKYDQPFMAYAINKYGWENVTHEILFDKLSKKEAELKEIELIAKYQSDKREFGYNLEKGGNIHGYSDCIFSTIKEVELVLRSGEITQDNIFSVISSMATYNFIVKHLDDDENYHDIVEWVKSHYKYYLDKSQYCSISQIKNNAIYDFPSNDLVIYKSELDTISSLENISYEKVLFILLCVAKLQRNVFGYKNGKYKLALTNIFKFARVNIKSSDRRSFIRKLLDDGYLELSLDDEKSYYCVTFMSDENEDEKMIHINEIDFAELAYVYENWKNNGNGFVRCLKCGRLILRGRTKPRKYCKECAEYKKIGYKTVQCVDCGKEFTINSLASAVCRCEECQSKHVKQQKSKRNKRYYQSKKQKQYLKEIN